MDARMRRLMEQHSTLQAEHVALREAHAEQGRLLQEASSRAERAEEAAAAASERCAQLETHVDQAQGALQRVCSQRQEAFHSRLSEVARMSGISYGSAAHQVPPAPASPSTSPLGCRGGSAAGRSYSDPLPATPSSTIASPASPSASRWLHRSIGAACADTDDGVTTITATTRSVCDALTPLPPIASAASASAAVPPSSPPPSTSSPPPFPPAVDVGDTPTRSSRRLKRFGLHFSPPGLALEYDVHGTRRYKHLDVGPITADTDVDALADHLIEAEPLVSVSRKPQLCRALHRLVAIVAAHPSGVPETQLDDAASSLSDVPPATPEGPPPLHDAPTPVPTTRAAPLGAPTTDPCTSTSDAPPPSAQPPSDQPPTPALVQLSVALKDLCRHDATARGVPITSDGWITLSDALQHLSSRLGRAVLETEVRQIVAGAGGNHKKRFELCEGLGGAKTLLRAAQGHTMRQVGVCIGTLLDEATAPHLAVHGTYSHALSAIKAHGVSRMRRHHVHLATDVPGSEGVLSGARPQCDAFVWVDVRRAIRAGLRFFRSSNGVLLCEGDADGAIPPAFFAKVELKVCGELVPYPPEPAPQPAAPCEARPPRHADLTRPDEPMTSGATEGPIHGLVEEIVDEPVEDTNTGDGSQWPRPMMRPPPPSLLSSLAGSHKSLCGSADVEGTGAVASDSGRLSQDHGA